MAYTVSLFPPLPYPFTPFSPSLINLVVSVDVKHHAYLLTVVCLQAGIAIYTVGVGLSDKGEMESVASSPRNVFAVSDYRELESNVYSLRSEIKARESRPKATFPNITCGNVNVCRYMRGQKHQVCRYLCGQNHQVCYYVKVETSKFVIMCEVKNTEFVIMCVVKTSTLVIMCVVENIKKFIMCRVETSKFVMCVVKNTSLLLGVG